jgi:hypothetical protein
MYLHRATRIITGEEMGRDKAYLFLETHFNFNKIAVNIYKLIYYYYYIEK